MSKPKPTSSQSASISSMLLRTQGIMRKHLWLIAACCFGTILVTALVVLMTVPIYTAETTLLIERQAPQVLNIREFLAEPSTVSKEKEDGFYKTQYEILKSRSLAAQVIQKQQLETEPAFTGEGQDKGFGPRLLAHVQEWVAAAQGWVKRLLLSPPKPVAEDALTVNPEFIDAYLGMLKVQPVRGTVAYLRAADNVSGPRPICLRGVNQPIIRTPNGFSRPRLALLVCI